MEGWHSSRQKNQDRIDAAVCVSWDPDEPVVIEDSDFTAFSTSL